MIRRRKETEDNRNSMPNIANNQSRSNPSNNKRRKVSAEVFEMGYASQFVRFFALAVCLIVSTMYYDILHPIFFVVCLIAIGSHLFFVWKQLAFETIVLIEVFQYYLGFFEWYNAVDDNLLLGAIPLEQLQHGEHLQRLGVSVVISIVEPFELTSSTLFGRPVSPDFWERNQIEHIILQSPDFKPPSVDLLMEGSQLLDKYLREGKRVYIHCKSGRGRSASMVLAYFYRYRYRHSSLRELCFPKLKSRRNAIFNDQSPQMRQLERFVNQLSPQSNNL